MASSDWRLTDRLDRIEEKLDRLIALIEADREEET